MHSDIVYNYELFQFIILFDFFQLGEQFVEERNFLFLLEITKLSRKRKRMSSCVYFCEKSFN